MVGAGTLAAIVFVVYTGAVFMAGYLAAKN